MEQVFIGPLNPNLQVLEIRTPQSRPVGKDGPDFGEILRDAISAVNELQKQSDLQIQKLMAGESQDVRTTVIAMQKADLSCQMMMEACNKIVQAYQEIMLMQI